jgi:ABC-type sugar transport system substrate-binding protein
LAQNDAVDAMISGGINFLIISPYDGAEQAIVGDKCVQQGIPYITMNTRIAQIPGENGYVCTIERDPYLEGVLTGLSVVQAMTEQHGQPQGNIGELAGVVSDNASILWSMGVRRVFAAYDNLNVVCSMEAGGDNDTRYKAAVNLLKAFREDELDGIITYDDETAVAALQAMADYDRGDMTGRIWSAGGSKAGLTAVWYGDIAQTIERTGQTGMVALEYALQYLEGGGQNIPAVVPAMARVFAAKSQEQKDAVAAIIADMDAAGVEVCFESLGSSALFAPDADTLSTAYPTPYYLQDEGYLAEFEPYTTADAIYNRGDDE